VNTISLCIIADTHRRHREIAIPPCDILIHCGDMCSFQRDDLGTLQDVDDWRSFLESNPQDENADISGIADYLDEFLPIPEAPGS
jgi:hypothetical protein